MAWFAEKAQGGGFIGVEDDISSTDTIFLWNQPAPKDYLYPWQSLRFPSCKTAKETKELVECIKKKGNESFGRGDHYDALWKYEHALLLCRSYPSLKSETAAILSNIAAACLKLGDTRREDLLDPFQFPLSYFLWYGFTQKHASEALSLNPGPKVAHKAHWRRGDSLRKLVNVGNSMRKMGHLMPQLFPSPSSDPYVRMVYDFVRCFELQEFPDPKVLCDAIQIAVQHDQTKFLPILQEKHIHSGFSSNLLKELISRPSSTLIQINFLLDKLKFNTKQMPHFDTSSLPPALILKKDFVNADLLSVLMNYGMSVTMKDVKSVAHLLPKERIESLRRTVAPRESAEEFSKERFEGLKKKGNKFFAEGKFEEALGEYFRALNYCQKFNMPEEMALVRSNCALACIKLHLYSDAYSHCCECIKMDPKMHKGYFRRAIALNAMIASSTTSDEPPGTLDDVRNDYLQSHRLEPNLEAYCRAIYLCVEQDCTHLLPKIHHSDVTSGFSTKVLRQVVLKDKISEKQLHFMLFDLPDSSITKAYDTSQFSVLVVLQITTDCKILERMFALGMDMREGDLAKAVEILPSTDVDAFELLIIDSTDVDLACTKAMELRKISFIELLIEHGATPPRDKLLDVVGFSSNPVVQDYLSSVVSVEDRLYRELMHRGMGDWVGSHVQEKNTVRALNNEAKAYFKDGDTMSALGRYDKAMEICNKYGLQEEAASIHSNCAHLLLQNDRYYEAYQHADSCIKINPNFAKAYIRRAEALKKALQSGRFHIPSHLTFDNVIGDYVYGHGLKTNMKAYGEALILAVDHDKREIVVHCRGLPVDFCNKLLMEIFPRPECKQPHLQFLLCDMWVEKDINVSQIKLSQLIVDKRITDHRLFAQFLELGVPVTKVEVKKVIHSLKTDQQPLFKFIVQKCKQEDLDELSQVAIAAKKMSLVLSLVEQGAKLPGHGQELLSQALKSEDYDGAIALVKKFTKATLNKLDLGVLIDSNLVRSPQLIEMLIDAGVSPNGNAKMKPLVVVMGLPYLLPATKVTVACLLIKKGAECDALCATSKNSTTPLHVATEVALKSDGDTRLIEAVASSPTFKTSGKLSNEKGESPLHLSVKSHWKKDLSMRVLSALIATEVVDPSKRDQSGKRPIDYLPRKDPRIPLLEKALNAFKPSSAQTKKKRGKKRTAPKNSNPELEPKKLPPKEPPVLETVPPVKEKKKIVVPEQTAKKSYENMSPMEKLEEQLVRVMKKEQRYFTEESETTVEPESADISVMIDPNEQSDNTTKVAPTRSDGNEADKKLPSSASNVQQSTCTSPLTQSIAGEDQNNVSSMLSEYGLDFDNLPWEVEVTAKVVKYFKDTKRNPPVERVRAAHTIYSIAEGKRGDNLSKRVSHDSSLLLFEARVTKGSRILWEKAISYSSKLTGPSPTPIYTHVIRVWEIVSDHDDLDRAIKYCVEQIEQSHNRGHQASIKWNLQPDDGSDCSSSNSSEKIRGREIIDIPTRFLIPNVTSVPALQHHFVPAGSTKKDEYNVTTFYSFDTITSRSMLLATGTKDRRDFPFKEWQKEHEIIKLDPKEAILLLGRSGTGKTTCCLYRLWNEFKDFWNPNSSLYGIKRRRRQLISPVMLPEVESSDSDGDDGDIDSDDSCSDDGSQTELNQNSPTFELVSASKERLLSNTDTDARSNASQDKFHSTKSQEHLSENPPSSSCDDDSQCVVDTQIIEEDIHQVFVTKNYVLCHQMKTRFYDLAAAHNFLEPHMAFEREEHPNNFNAFHNHSFPLFLTARQFYILLDNSLGGENTFFKRDQDGNLLVKILSFDYDHEDADTLLDLESSDSEGEGVESVGGIAVEATTGKQHTEKWREVTALYFKEIVWPHISYQCGVTSKDFDPLLVWIEIQSFIKGSEMALRKGSPLNLEEYHKIGNRMAPNFSSHRDKIYTLFKKYQRFQQNQRHKNYLFDECDLILHLYKRLKSTRDVPWSIHSLYIDEVQDFTQAELAIFIHCCRDPNSMFFTGDTAQSIMRGIAFRFQDLRSCFHRIHDKIKVVNVPQKPYNLTINFRSHSGILKLAGSVIDLISEFFKDSIDHLPDDEGMFQGPTPVLLESCEVDDLALLLSTNKRERSAIEFGAHQAVIVQSREAKEKLPDILRGAIVLTIFEAKGLEFDDVLLYNFFADSMMDEKGWRVITSYLQMSQHSSKICTESKLPGSTVEPRSCTFDPKVHKSLNAELKYLYTAITRAKCNLWIYDSDKKNRLPIFDYWHKRNLVKVVRAKDSGNEQGMYMLVFTSNSTSEQWKVQGDNFKEKHLWEQAVLCYERAGKENEYLAKEASAYLKMQQARVQKPALYLEAAIRFLECDQLHHSVRYLTGAALCLKNARPPKYSQAARLYEKLGETGKAAQVYLKSKDIKNFARLKESRGEHTSVIRALLGKNLMKKREALAKADEYERAGIMLDPDLSTSELSYSCAKFYSKIKDEKTLREVLKYMPDLNRRAKFLKEAELYDEAYKVYVEHKQYSDAFRLVSAHGSSHPDWFESGLNLAREIGDKKSQSVFMFQRAKVELYRGDERNEVSIKDLSSLKNSGSDKLVVAQVNLLLGMIENDAGLCKVSWGTFKLLKNKVGELEAFNQVLELTNYKESIQSLLDSCHLSRVVSSALENLSDINKDVQDAVRFYGLQKIGNFYLTPPSQDIWIGEPLLKCVCKESRYDLDGMLKLNADDARDRIAEHVRSLGSKWLSKFQLEKKLQPTFKLHDRLWNDKSLSREYSQQEVSSKALQEYIQTCLYKLQYCRIIEGPTESVVHVLLAVFSPQVAIYLPQRLQEEHVSTIRRSVHSHPAFHSWLNSTVIKPAKSLPVKVFIDKWLMAWRACCITTPDYKVLFDALGEIESQKAKHNGGSDPPPVGFLFWKKEQRHYHLFRIWLNACVAIRENAQPLWAARLTIEFFLGRIAQSQNVSISVINAVDILTLQCTALLAMLAQSNALQNRTSSCTVPMHYKHTVQLFNHMNTVRRADKTGDSKGHKWLLAACAEEVSKSKRNYSAIFKDCMVLLIKSIDLLLGTSQHAPRFCILKFALQQFPHSDATRHCLILTLVLFGNLSMIKVRGTSTFHQKITSILKRSLSKNDKMPNYVATACKASMSPNFSHPQQVFELVEHLLSIKSSNHDLAKLVYRHNKGPHGKIDFAHLIPAPPTVPTPAPPVGVRLPTAALPFQHHHQQHQQPGPMFPVQPPVLPSSSGFAVPMHDTQQHVYASNVTQNPSVFQQGSPLPIGPPGVVLPSSTVPLPTPQQHFVNSHQHHHPPPPNWPATAVHVSQPVATSLSGPGFVQPASFKAFPSGFHPQLQQQQQQQQQHHFVHHNPQTTNFPHSPSMAYTSMSQESVGDVPFYNHGSVPSVLEQAAGSQNPIGAERRQQQQHIKEQLPQTTSSVPHTSVEPPTANVVASYTLDQLKELASQSIPQQPAAPTIASPERASFVSNRAKLPTSPDASSFSTDVDTGDRVYHFDPQFSINPEVIQPSPPLSSSSGQQQTQFPTETTTYKFELPDDFEDQREMRGEGNDDEDGLVEYFNQQDDLDFALTAGTLPNDVHVVLDPEMVDGKIVSFNFCDACGVSLKIEDIYSYQLVDDISVESESAENYYSHINSEQHRINLVACKKFLNMIENESGLELYPQLRQRMNDLLYDCERLKQSSSTDKLDRIIDNLQEEAEKNNVTLSQLQEQRLWRRAIEEMTKMVDSVDRLLKASSGRYRQVREEVAAHEKAERERLVEDLLEQEQFAEDVRVEGKPSTLTSGAQNAAATAMRTHDQKVKSRQKKRQRHRTRHHQPGGGGD